MTKILWLFVLIVLGFFVGIPMGLNYPFERSFKIIYLISVVFCVIAFIFGIIFRKKYYGKLAIAVSLCLWTFLGFIGLGTGT